MSGVSWVPGAIVLAIGLVVGVLIALRFRRQAAARPPEDEPPLEIADLVARRDELFAKLRELGPEGDQADREVLERAAARTLRELDRAGVDAGQPARPAAKPAPAAAAAAGGRTFVTGFLYGAGLFALLAALVYWALRDAKPRPEEGGAPQAAGAVEAPHPETDELPPELAARITELERRLAANPDDVAARKEIAYLLLDSGSFFEAFGQANAILELQPQDADALYISGIVRLTMGQREQGSELVDRALASDPRHVPSHIARGILRLQEGDRETALAIWERGLEAAGGSHPGLERLLASTRAGASIEEILGAPPPTAEPAAPAPGPAPAAPQPAAVPEPAPPPRPSPAAQAADIYDVRLELAPGARPIPGSVLFVILRGPGGGPPVAVRRIGNPTFPLELVLGPEDSMMGGELPASGMLSARLDADGSASTDEPGDLSAEAAAASGGSTTLVLSAR